MRAIRFVVILLLAFPAVGWANGSRYACFVGAAQVFADRELTGNLLFCNPLPREEGWDEVLFDSFIAVDYEKASLRKSGNTVDVRLAFRSSDPLQGLDGSFSYDLFKGHYRFDCQARTQQMSEAVYFLDAKRVHGQQPGETLDEPVRPGTASDRILNRVCFGIDPYAADKLQYAGLDDPDFICPEYKPDADAKTQDLKDFMARMAARNPHITLGELTKARYGNLVLHRCQKTLNYIATHAGKGGG